MDIGYVLLSPKGRIGPRDFLRGLILLTGASMIVQLLSTYAARELAILHYPIMWGYFCVFGKRLHDAGQSAWFGVLVFIGYFIVSLILSAMLTPLLSPQVLPIQAELESIGLKGDFAAMWATAQERAMEIARKSALTSLATFLIASAGLAFLGARLPSDPGSNAHGPSSGPRDAS